MSNPVDSEPELTALTTVLNRVRPTVVVRRRVYEVAREQPAAVGFVDEEDDEDGPPSSVNVARALASLRGDELRRLEEILSATDNEPDPESLAQTEEVNGEDPAKDVTTVRAIKVGATISVPELARRLGVETKDLVTTLVASGYFSTTGKSVLTRENATAAAWMFGWTVEAVDEPESAPKKKAATKKKK